jgi:hypothetical protein
LKIRHQLVAGIARIIHPADWIKTPHAPVRSKRTTKKCPRAGLAQNKTIIVFCSQPSRQTMLIDGGSLYRINA